MFEERHRQVVGGGGELAVGFDFVVERAEDLRDRSLIG